MSLSYLAYQAVLGSSWGGFVINIDIIRNANGDNLMSYYSQFEENKPLVEMHDCVCVNKNSIWNKCISPILSTHTNATCHIILTSYYPHVNLMFYLMS